MAEGLRARIRGVWLERCWSRRPEKAVYDRDRTHVESIAWREVKKAWEGCL